VCDCTVAAPGVEPSECPAAFGAGGRDPQVGRCYPRSLNPTRLRPAAGLAPSLPRLGVGGGGRATTGRSYVIDWAAAWRSFAGLDVVCCLAVFDAPTLVLGGKLDASTTPEIMCGIAERIAGAR
jgi:hypothetical protein